jgi:hypothetical protein
MREAHMDKTKTTPGEIERAADLAATRARMDATAMAMLRARDRMVALRDRLRGERFAASFRIGEGKP